MVVVVVYVLGRLMQSFERSQERVWQWGWGGRGHQNQTSVNKGKGGTHFAHFMKSQ